jgi:hypothetical protein
MQLIKVAQNTDDVTGAKEIQLLPDLINVEDLKQFGLEITTAHLTPKTEEQLAAEKESGVATEIVRWAGNANPTEYNSEGFRRLSSEEQFAQTGHAYVLEAQTKFDDGTLVQTIEKYFVIV